MRRLLLSGLLAFSAVSFAGIGIARAADPVALFKAVTIAEAPQGLAVSIETSGPLRYQASVIESPYRIVIDVAGVYAASKAKWLSTPEPIKEIRGSQWKPGTARLVVELTQPARYRIDEGPTGLTLIIDGSGSGEAKAESPRLPDRAAKAEAVKIDTPAANAPKSRAAKIEAAKVSATDLAKVETTPFEPVKSEIVKPLPVKMDPIKREAARPEPVTREQAKPEPIKVEPVMPEAQVAEAVKTDGGAIDAPARDAIRPIPAAASTTTLVVMPVSAAPPVLPPRVAQAAPGGSAPAQPTVRESITHTGSNGGKLITLDFKDADVVNVLRLLAAEGGRNIVVGDDVKGKVSVSLRNVTWEQALDTILEARGLQKLEKAGVIRIVSSEQLARERDAQLRAAEAKRKAEIEERTRMAEAQVKEQDARQRRLVLEAAAAQAEARGPLKEEVIKLTYADAGEVANTLQGVLGLGLQTIVPCRRLEGGQPANAGGGSTSGPIAEPPFSQLFGPPRQQEAPPPPTVSADVVANRLTIRTYCPANSLFIRLFAADLDRVKTLIREHLDVPLPQVKIEARMEILDRTALEAIGVQWGGGGVGNTGKATVVGQGFGSQNTGGGIPPSNFQPINPNMTGSSLLPISPVTGLPAGANLVNLPLGAFANAAAAVPTAGLAFGIIGSNFNINLALQALNEMGKTHTLARPEIVTVENNRAAISLGEEIPYATISSAGTQIQFKDALLRLEVTPTVIRERIGGMEHTKIKMVVVVENNDRGEVVNLGQSGTPPAINKRKAETLVLMNEGERLVIGGVTTATNQNTIRKVPMMGDVPVLGWLFKAKSDSSQGRELVVFVTPSVLRSMVAGSAVRK